MRSLLVITLALAATPAFAQQAPGLSGPEALSENYRDQPFIFDLLLRMKPVEEGERTRFLKDEHQAICVAEMNQSLRVEGLANTARQVYRDCADRLAAAERNGEAIPAPPPRSMRVPMKGQFGRSRATPLPPPCEPPPTANAPTNKPAGPSPCPATR
jgi:hypothetical protein